MLRAPGRSQVTVRLQVRVTELGALEIGCVEPDSPPADGRPPWRLSFDVRAGAGVPEADAPTEDSRAPPPPAPIPAWRPAKELLARAFNGPGPNDDTLARVLKLLEEALATPRNEWPIATARALFDASFALEEQRKRSAHHEARWLNLTGFCLRPGRGRAARRLASQADVADLQRRSGPPRRRAGAPGLVDHLAPDRRRPGQGSPAPDLPAAGAAVPARGPRAARSGTR